MMKNLRDQHEIDFELRSDAEAQLSRMPFVDATQFDAQNLLHELQVHQIALQMLSAQLRGVLIQLEQSRDDFAYLYELAPIAYLNLSSNGIISKINLAGTAMLAESRMSLLATNFADFISDHQRAKWSQLFSDLIQSGGHRRVDLALTLRDRRKVYVQLDAHIQQIGADGTEVLLTLQDVSEHHRAEAVKE
jgi:hypothetical protein